MSPFLRTALLGACLCLADSAAADAAAGDVPQPQVVGLRASVDAGGKVLSAQGTDPQSVLNRAAEEIARKLLFSPARKNGVPVPSETNITLTLALEQRPDGRFGLQLKRAYNGPGVLRMGTLVPPERQQGRDSGALVVVGVLVDADGSPDMDSMTADRMELRVPSKFAEARYLESVKASLRGTRFELDKVDGAAVPSRVSVPYLFGGGPAKLKPGEDYDRGARKAAQVLDMPAMQAVSKLPGIELAKLDYRAPPETAATPAPPPAK